MRTPPTSRRSPPPGVEPFRFEGMEGFEEVLAMAKLADEIARRQRRERPWLAYQLGKSGLSVLNNTAEAIGEYSPGDKARFFRYALREASELGAMIVFMARNDLISQATEATARRLTLKVMKQLGRKAIHFQRKAARRER